MVRSTAIARSALLGARGRRISAPSSASVSQRPLSTARQEDLDEPPTLRGSFGAKFDWADPLRFNSLLTEDEVCWFTERVQPTP